MPSRERRVANRCDVGRRVAVYHAGSPVIQGKTTNLTEHDIHFVVKQGILLREVTQIQIELDRDMLVSCQVMIARSEPASLGRIAYGSRVVAWNGDSLNTLRRWLNDLGHQSLADQAA